MTAIQPSKITEGGQQMLRQLYTEVKSLTTDLQTSQALQISSKTVHRELHAVGFYG